MSCEGPNLFFCPTASSLCVSVPLCHEEEVRAPGVVPPVSAESGQPWGMLTILCFVQLLLQSCRGMHPVNTYTSRDFSGFRSWVFRGHRNFFQHFPVFVSWHCV